MECWYGCRGWLRIAAKTSSKRKMEICKNFRNTLVSVSCVSDFRNNSNKQVLHAAGRPLCIVSLCFAIQGGAGLRSRVVFCALGSC